MKFGLMSCAKASYQFHNSIPNSMYVRVVHDCTNQSLLSVITYSSLNLYDCLSVLLHLQPTHDVRFVAVTFMRTLLISTSEPLFADCK